jgi:EmrB/QacA subfamily drug resistance transporter
LEQKSSFRSIEEKTVSQTTASIDTAGPEAGPQAAFRWRWLAFLAVMAVSVMDLLDSTIANVAAPAIRDDLGGSYASLQWIAAGYTLAMAVMLLTGGRLGDLYGRKRVLLTGVTGFTIASLLAAAAQSPEMLIGSRVLQGGLGAVMLPQVMGLIRDVFPPAEMGKAFAIFGPVMALSAVLGPIIAGVLIDADLLGTGWRMIFLVNLPIGATAIVIGAKFLPDAPASERTSRLDLSGVGIAAAGALLLVYPLVQGRELGWPVWTQVMIAASIVVFAAFGRYQLRRKRAGSSTLIETSLFANRSYVSGVAFMLVFFAAMGGFTLTLSALMQVGLGYSPMRTGLTTAAWAVGAFVGAGVGGAMTPKLGRTIVHVGLALMGAGLAALTLVLVHAGSAVGSWDFVAPLFVSGIGLGMVFMPLFDLILGGVADHEVGSASGMQQAIQQLGASLGVAVVGTIFFDLLGARGSVDTALHAAEITALVTIGLIALAFAIGFLLPRKVRSHGPPAEASAPAGAEPAFA